MKNILNLIAWLSKLFVHVGSPKEIVTKCILLKLKLPDMTAHYRAVTQLTSDICGVLGKKTYKYITYKKHRRELLKVKQQGFIQSKIYSGFTQIKPFH